MFKDFLNISGDWVQRRLNIFCLLFVWDSGLLKRRVYLSKVSTPFTMRQMKALLPTDSSPGTYFMASFLLRLPADMIDHIISKDFKDVKQLQQFLGIVNFYRRFLTGIARTLQPLTDALQGAPKTLEWPPPSERPRPPWQLRYHGAPRPERCALPSNRRLWHTCRRRASTAQVGELAAASVLLQEAVGGRHQVLHLRQRAVGQLQRGQTFPIPAGRATVSPPHRPQATGHISVPHHAIVDGPPTVTALLHRRIHIRHQTHTRPRERGGQRLEPPANSSRTATAVSSADLSRSHCRGLAGERPGGTGAARFGCHRRCAACRFFGDSRCAAILPGGGRDDELHHTADHNPGGRRRLAARGRFNRSVQPACTHPT